MLKDLLLSTTQKGEQYRPTVFRLPVDEGALHHLLKDRPDIQVFDRIQAQLRELIKSLNPGTKLAEDALQAAIDKHLSGRELSEYGSWVFYPWCNRLVHLLDAEEFAIVRTDRNRNKITREEQVLLATKKVGVIGLSVGQSVSLTMALERCFGEIRLADFDTLDLSNLNRIRTSTSHLGMNKAIVTAREIAEIDPYLKVVCFTDGLTRENMDAFFTEGGKLDILVEECDSVDIKIMARQKAKALRIPVVMDMSDRGCLDVERFDLEPERPLMHGWIDHLDLDAASRPMSAEEKVPYMLPITGVETLSPRMKASVIELGQTISTWPQLATSVVLGGAVAGDAVRRIALDEFHASGRWFVDLEEQVADPPGSSPPPSPLAPQFELTEEERAALSRQLPSVSITALELDEELVAELVLAGSTAPSYGNMQPWEFVWHQRRLLVFRNPHRSASVWDRDGMMAHLALGACVENIVLKAADLGLGSQVHASLDEHAMLTAWLEFHQAASEHSDHAEWARLAAMIPERRTDRAIGRPMPMALSTMDQLSHLAGNGDGCVIHWVHSSAQLQELGELHGMAERLHMMHPEGHREYFSKLIRWNEKEAEDQQDGLDLGTFNYPPMAEAAMKVMSDPKAMTLLRKWNGGTGLSQLPGIAIRSSSAVALISAPKDEPGAWLEAGRCSERLWLACNAEKWAVQPLSSIISLTRTFANAPHVFSLIEQEQMKKIAERFALLFGSSGSVPLFLLRVFHTASTAHRKGSKRRPLDSMLLNPMTAK
jgi:hypothetical protein